MTLNMEALAGLVASVDQRDRLYGVTVGLVTNNNDPDGLARVKVRFPWLSDQDESYWARVLTPMAGNGRGFYALPEVDDEVLVAFEHGRVEFPYVLGALWNGKDVPPEPSDNGKNNMRTFKSRSGHIVRLDDTDGEGKIEILDSSGKNSIVITTKNNTVTISADADIAIKASQGKVTISGSGGVEITSDKDVKVNATGNLNLQASAQTVLKGATVNIN